MRACGECVACCTGVFEFEEEGHKVAGKPCEFLTENGCSIYKNRPKVCREFNCAWRVGSKFVVPLPFTARPDLSGAVFHPVTDVYKGEAAICGAQCGDIVDHSLEKWIDECLEAKYWPVIVPQGSTLRVLTDKATGKVKEAVSYF